MAHAAESGTTEFGESVDDVSCPFSFGSAVGQGNPRKLTASLQCLITYLRSTVGRCLLESFVVTASKIFVAMEATAFRTKILG